MKPADVDSLRRFRDAVEMLIHRQFVGFRDSWDSPTARARAEGALQALNRVRELLLAAERHSAHAPLRVVK